MASKNKRNDFNWICVVCMHETGVHLCVKHKLLRTSLLRLCLDFAFYFLDICMQCLR